MRAVIPMKIGMSPSGSTTANRETKQTRPNAAAAAMRAPVRSGYRRGAGKSAKGGELEPVPW